MSTTNSWRTLAEFQTLVEAQTAKSFLESHGFSIQLRDQHITSLYGTPLSPSSGIQIQIQQKDYITAKNLLEKIQQQQD